MDFEVKLAENQKNTTVELNENQEQIVTEFKNNSEIFSVQFGEHKESFNAQLGETQARTHVSMGDYQTLQGVGISKIEKITTEGLVDTYVIILTNGKTYFFTVTNGIVGKDGKDGKDGYTPIKDVDYFDGKDGKDGYTPIKDIDYFDGKDGKDGYTPIKDVDYFDGKDGADGTDGVGIANITKGAINGNVDTYFITLTNGIAYAFTVTNGKDYVLTEDDKIEIAELTGEFINLTPFEKAKLWVEEKAEEVEEKANAAKAWVEDTGTSITKWMSDTGEDIVDFGQAIENSIAEANKDVREWIEGVGDGITNFGDAIGKAIADGNQKVEDSVNEVKDWIEDTGNAIETKVNEVKDWVDETGKNIQEGITNAQNWIDDTGDAIEIKVNEVKEWVDGVKDWVDGVGEGASAFGQKIETDITNAKNEIKSDIDEAKTNLQNGINDAKTNFENGINTLNHNFNSLVSRITGIAWELKDITKIVNKDITYDFEFISNGDKYNRLKYYCIDYNGYLVYQKVSDTEFVNNVVYQYENGVSSWTDYAYKTIITDDINVSLTDIGAEINLELSMIERLGEKSKTMLGAIENLVDVEELGTDIKGWLNGVGDGVSRFGSFVVEKIKEIGAMLFGSKEVVEQNTADIGDMSQLETEEATTFSLRGTEEETTYQEEPTTYSVRSTPRTLVGAINNVHRRIQAMEETPYQSSVDENLETGSKEIVGAINELNKKINPRPTYLKGKTYYIPSGWEATAGYGKFDVECDVSVSGNNLTRTRFSLGYKVTSSGLLPQFSPLANSIIVDNGVRLTITDYYVFDNTNSFTITFNDGNTTNTSLIDWVTTWGVLQEKELAEEMPQIRFVGMPCEGYLGWVDWSQITGYQEDSYENLKFTLEIVSGTLQVGDAIQICRMGHYGASASTSNGVKKYHPKKKKLRRLFEYTVTEEDLEKRFITFTVPWNSKKAIKLFTNCVIGGINDRPIYFRVRRPKGEINSGSNGGGMTVDALFSNVVSIRVYSYYYSWYPPTGSQEEEYFYHIRIT